jgi:hypothetical protein
MNGKCNQNNCGHKEGLACDMGHGTYAECPHFEATEKGTEPKGATSTPADDLGQRLPWSGRALGFSDMMLASGRSSASLAGLIGPFDAGKTSFLTAVFSHFADQGIVTDYSFAGSFTLEAWARLRQHTEWPATQRPTFPPHTPDSGERVPSLLHLAFRRHSELVKDFLFTDAPGEWFTRWLRNENGDDARGARWIADHATHFLFFVDRKALASADVGTARHNIQTLGRRIAEIRGPRPVFVIWTKSDESCNEEVEKPIRQRLTQFFGEHQSWDLHAKDPRCLDVLASLLSSHTPKTESLAPVVANKSAFMAFGQK